MNVVFIHHHLNRGGVTQVLAHHLRAMLELDSTKRPTGIAVVHGGRSDQILEPIVHTAASPMQLGIIPALDYDGEIPPNSPALTKALLGWLEQNEYQPNETILHVHNHSLGKNAKLPGTLSQLASTGYRLLLHIHDFAEDYRPKNYQGLLSSLPAKSFGSLYPQAPQIHYAVLNQRDRSALTLAGVPNERLHWLPNPAPAFTNLPAAASAREAINKQFPQLKGRQFWLYPVRGIRRKNLGEAILWSALEQELTIGFTLPPTNPVEIPHYQRWKRFAEELKLPCLFELGLSEQLEFPQLLAAADAILTTSVAEGFGLVFLEAFLAGKQLVGRDLPSITSDFKQAGMQFEFLAPKFEIPTEWLGSEVLVERLCEVEKNLRNDYQLVADTQSEARVESLCKAVTIDFAHLPSDLQRATIQQVVEDSAKRTELLGRNPMISRSIERQHAENIIRQNADVIQQNYTLTNTGNRLIVIYRTLLTVSPDDEIHLLANADVIRDTFLSPDRLFPVRLEEREQTDAS